MRPDFPPIEDLMPHRGPVALLECILNHDAQHTEARIRIDDQQWQKRSDGSVASWLALEYMAQCIAAHESLLAIDEGRPPPTGFLVAASGLRLEVLVLPAGSILRVRTERVRGRPGLGALSHQCSLLAAHADSGEESLVAEGRLSVSTPRD